jgi:hypothetical protein
MAAAASGEAAAASVFGAGSEPVRRVGDVPATTFCDLANAASETWSARLEACPTSLIVGTLTVLKQS